MANERLGEQLRDVAYQIGAEVKSVLTGKPYKFEKVAETGIFDDITGERVEPVSPTGMVIGKGADSIGDLEFGAALRAFYDGKDTLVTDITPKTKVTRRIVLR